MLRNVLIIVGVVLIGVMVLMVSFARAGVEKLSNENLIETLGKNEIKIPLKNDEGEIYFEIYKLPETGVTPDNMMYGFKSIRDYLWLSFSSGVDKPKIMLLTADKKAAEYIKLIEKDKNDLAIESGNEAVNKLEYAYNLSTKIDNKNVLKKQLLTQIKEAGYAYKQVFILGESKFSLDEDKYRQLINKIDDWNKKQEKTNLEEDI